MKKRAIVLGLVILVSSCLIILPATTAQKNDGIWLEEITILDEPMSPGWWREKGDKSQVDYSYRVVTDSVYRLLSEEDNSLKSSYSTMYVNAYNNTVFIVVTGLDETLKSSIEEHLTIKPDVKIIYRTGVATNDDLMKWRDTIADEYDKLKQQGVRFAYSGIKQDGKIHLGVINLDNDKLSLIKKALNDKVPSGAISIYNVEKIESNPYASQTQENNPVLAGVKETSYMDGDSTWGWATTGFVVEWSDGGTKHGILIAGHMASEDSTSKKKVYQPTKTSSYHMGNTIDITNKKKADVALVELLGSQTYTAEVWSSSNDIIVTGERTYSQITVGDFVEGTGVASGVETAEVLDKGDCDDWDVWPCENGLRDQLWLEDVFTNGDSGAPIYIKYWEPVPQHFTALAVGTVVGGISIGNDDYCLTSPVDGIESALGNRNFDFS